MYMTEEKHKELKKDYTLVPVYKVLELGALTPIGIFDQLKALSPSYILESMEDKGHLGRYSFIGVETEEIETKDMSLSELENVLSKYKAPPLTEVPSSTATIIGYMTYNMIEEIFPIKLKKESSIPKYQLLLSKTIVAIDHLKKKCMIIVNCLHGDSYEMALRKIEKIQMMLSVANSVEKSTSHKKAPLTFKANIKKEDYFEKVKKAKDYIVAGDIFQVVLSQKFVAKGSVNGVSLYKQLRKVNPSPYLSYIKFNELEVLCSSPEMLVKLDNKSVETAPIAGTRAVKNDGKDEQRMMELSSDEKDKAEHLMLVDLGRNDIGKVSKAGTVQVPVYCQAKKFSKVMHLVSSVKGQALENVGPLDALKATFPAGTVSGAPKLRAMEIIDELETDSRDLYAGSIFMLNQLGHLNSCISIRTIQLKNDEVIVQAGGGIVYDSVAEHEYLEVINKSKAMFNAIESAYEGEVTYDF